MSNCYVNRFVDSFKGYFASNNPKSQQISGYKIPYVYRFVKDSHILDLSENVRIYILKKIFIWFDFWYNKSSEKKMKGIVSLIFA